MSKKRLYAFLLLACAVGYGWIIYNLNFASRIGEGNTCIIKNATGIPCPSCGSTRSIKALLQGNLAEALFINPMGILVTIIMVILPLWILIDFITKRGTLLRAYRKTETTLKIPWLAALLILLVLANWVWNINKGL